MLEGQSMEKSVQFRCDKNALEEQSFWYKMADVLKYLFLLGQEAPGAPFGVIYCPVYKIWTLGAWWLDARSQWELSVQNRLRKRPEGAHLVQP